MLPRWVSGAACIVVILALFIMRVMAIAQEKVALTVADVSVSRVVLDYDGGIVTITLNQVQSGNHTSKVYDSTTTPTGDALLTGLNKADLSVKSLQRRIYERLIADGVITGTITGTPK